MSTHPLKIRILLADDHTVVRRGLRMVLETAPDLDVVAEASDGIEAVERALREDIDLAILDVAMPRRTGAIPARIHTGKSGHVVVEEQPVSRYAALPGRLRADGDGQ